MIICHLPKSELNGTHEEEQLNPGEGIFTGAHGIVSQRVGLKRALLLVD